MEEPAKGSTSLRAMIAQAVTADATIEQVEQLIADVFQTTKARKVECPNCHTEHRIQAPDVRAQVQTLIDLLEQAEGRAGAEPQVDTVVIIERPPR
jgi:hypothetical protein